MILVTCTVSSFIVEKASQKLALKEEHQNGEETEAQEKILISLAYPETVTELIDFGLMLKPKKSNIPVYALNIISDEAESNKTASVGRKMMQKAVSHAAATEQTILPITRFDINISNGIIYTLKEQNITDLLIGLHQQANQHSFLGPTAEQILKHTAETVFIYKSVQPLNTIKRMVVIITARAELEPGFSHWFRKLSTIAKEAGLSLDFFATNETLLELQSLQKEQRSEGKMTFNQFWNWDDFLIFTREVKKNDLLVIVSSRKGQISYQHQLEKLPYYLSNYFTANSFIMLYPKQVEKGIKMDDVQYFDSTLAEKIAEAKVVSKAGSYLTQLFKKKPRGSK
jgi:hypothetical protein